THPGCHQSNTNPRTKYTAIMITEKLIFICFKPTINGDNGINKKTAADGTQASVINPSIKKANSEIIGEAATILFCQLYWNIFLISFHIDSFYKTSSIFSINLSNNLGIIPFL